ncbi:gonadotropin-releasing hormone receptor-like isoform X2 [Saccostrea echinata]|uniref:gonadotropin-releasing hormone receptor-like isoform X2 n=1 Tax=Saccostrea echinata TaxID=191078 RepID=UPI002A7EABF7|nr:gonadotropin-releasing hormone receptor-like isoform X2 [Saccostrea echinata]
MSGKSLHIAPYHSYGISSSAIGGVNSNGSENMTNVTEIESLFTVDFTSPLPPTFQDSLVKTVVLVVLFTISLIGNTATLIQMYRVRKRRSTINTLIVNLAISDLIVTFFCMAAEAIWALTVQWVAGVAMCKMLRFIQGTGLLVSTYITVVISLDRCCVITDPISRNKAPQRVKIMIIMSWFLSALFSVPQALLFSVHRGPFKEDFYQCVDILGYPSPAYKKLYNIFCMLIQFFLPLTLMIIAYGLILFTISRKSKEFGEPENVSNSSDQREHSGRSHVRSGLLRKAKRKALRMSIFIVIAFFICWLPYYVVFTGFAFGHWTTLNPSVMSGLTFVGLTNSILNPIIYGAFQLCKVPSNPRSWKKENVPGIISRAPCIRRHPKDVYHRRLSTRSTKRTSFRSR